MIVGFCSANVVLVLICCYIHFFWRRRLKVRYRRDEGFFKLILYTHGRLSLEELERTYTHDYAAGIEREHIIDQLAAVKGSWVKDADKWWGWYPWTHEEYTVADLEKTNKYSGTYVAGQGNNNARNLQRYRDTRLKRIGQEQLASELTELETKNIALRRILDDIAEGRA